MTPAARQEHHHPRDGENCEPADACWQRTLRGYRIAAPCAQFSVAFRTEHNAACGNALEAQKVMRDHNHCGPALPAERDGQVVDLFRAHGIEPGGRLVANEQLRVEREGPGEGGTLFIPPLSSRGYFRAWAASRTARNFISTVWSSNSVSREISG